MRFLRKSSGELLLTLVRIRDYAANVIERLNQLSHNSLLAALLMAVFFETFLFILIVGTIEIPPDSLLESGLQNVQMVFEG